MPNVSKRFAARVTDSFDRRFRRSRWILTLTYVVILTAILASSGGITRWMFSHSLEGRFRGVEAAVVVGVNRPIPPHMMDYLRADLLEATLVVNGTLLLLAGLLSYWLAGFTLRPIQAAYNRQREFLSDISHELRTPLAIMQTNLENELRDRRCSDLQPQLRSHLEEVERMSRLVGDSLTLSRLDSRREDSRPDQVVDLRGAALQTVERLRTLADREGIELEFRSVGDGDLSVSTYGEEMLDRLVENLVGNAIKYNRPGGRVEVIVESGGRLAVLRVSDTGCGIPAGDREKVFSRFYRAEKCRSRQSGGSGLGLAIVRSTVDVLGGTVSLRSAVGKGTEVTVSLPVHRTS